VFAESLEVHFVLWNWDQESLDLLLLFLVVSVIRIRLRLLLNYLIHKQESSTETNLSLRFSFYAWDQTPQSNQVAIRVPCSA